MNRSTLVLGALGIIVTSFAAGWILRPDTSGTARGAESRVESEGHVPRAEYDRVRRELAAATDRETAQQNARKKEEEAVIAEAKAADAAAAQTEDPKAPRFIYGPLETSLRQVDWNAVGDSLAAMPPLLEELATALIEGKEIPARVGEIQRWNGPLVTQALTAERSGVSGTGTNGAFTHPAMVVNAVHAALERSDAPLNDAQRATLDSLGMRFIEEEERRLASYDENTISMAKLVQECAMKDRLYTEVDALLSPTQREILHPSSTRGIAGVDLFSSGLIWVTVAGPLPFDDGEQLQAMLAQRIQSAYGLPEGALPVVTDLVRKALDQLGQEYLAVPIDDAVSKGRMMRVARIRAAADALLGLKLGLARSVALDAKQLEKLREDTVVVVPYWRGGGN